MLSVQQLEAGYGDSVILRDISIEVKPGQVVCLMGRNGVGKTTLVKSIMGVLKARKGSVTYNGRDITKLPPYARAKSGIGLVPQGREIFGQLTVKENLLLGLEANRMTRISVPKEAIAKFPVLPTMYERRGGDLSGGQQQQLAFARALAANPDLLLLDEPTEGIQPSIIKDIGRAIDYLRKKGEMAILLVEQYFEFARDLADHYAVMDRGQVVLSGTRAEMVEADVRRRLSV